MHPRHLAKVDVGMIPRYAGKASNPQVNTAAPPHEEPRTTWSKSRPPVLWIRAILRGHTQNTNGNDVRLRAEAHSKGCRGSAYEGHPSTRGDRTAGQVSPWQSDPEPRWADTYSTAPSPSQITRVEGSTVLWSTMSGGWQAAGHRAGASLTSWKGYRCLRQGIQRRTSCTTLQRAQEDR
jgi:hypothetical protein